MMENPQAMRRILLIVAYFGRLPAYFDLWLQSCARNPHMDWLVVTDDLDGIPPELPSNVSVRFMEFAAFRSLLEAHVGVAPNPMSPYKLVDFKPTYGSVFIDDLADYTHWGYCDLDMIFGQPLEFIPNPVFDEYPKIFNRGHFTLYANTEEARSFYTLEAPGIDPLRVLAAPQTAVFDEWTGIHAVLNHHGIPQYHDEVIADIDPRRLPMATTRHTNHRHQVFYWENGRVYRAFVTDDGIATEEYAYIHFQKRPMPRGGFPAGEPFYITHRGFTRKPGPPDPETIVDMSTPSLKERAEFVVRRTRSRIRNRRQIAVAATS